MKRKEQKAAEEVEVLVAVFKFMIKECSNCGNEIKYYTPSENERICDNCRREKKDYSRFLDKYSRQSKKDRCRKVRWED